MTEETTALLEGHISIMAAMNGRSRDIELIVIRENKNDRDTARLERAAQSHRIPVERVPAEEIDRQANGSTHGGVIAWAGPRRTQEMVTLLPELDSPFIAMLDGIEDPFNFGYAVRALYAAGVDGIVVRPRNWMSAAGTVARSSAGASELVPLAVAETALDAADFFRKKGLTVATTGTLRTAESIYEADLSVPLFILIGGERRGITRSFLRQADMVLRIPYGRSYDKSLGTTAAAAVIAFEIMRQRSLP